MHVGGRAEGPRVDGGLAAMTEKWFREGPGCEGTEYTLHSREIFCKLCVLRCEMMQLINQCKINIGLQYLQNWCTVGWGWLAYTLKIMLNSLAFCNRFWRRQCDYFKAKESYIKAYIILLHNPTPENKFLNFELVVAYPSISWNKQEGKVSPHS